MVYERNRDMMKAFYRLLEKYERYPQGMNREELEAYWMKIGEDIVAFSSQFKDCDPMAMQLGLALMNAREAEYKDEWSKPESKARQMTFEEATEQC